MEGDVKGVTLQTKPAPAVGTPLSILGGDPKTNYGRKGKFIERIFLLSQTASINTYKNGEIITYK